MFVRSPFYNWFKHADFTNQKLLKNANSLKSEITEE